MDDELVTIHHRLTSKGISAIPEIFNSPYYQDNMGYSYEYRPFVLSTFAIEHEFFGDNPNVSHFVNVLLYAFCCLLLFEVLSALLLDFNSLFLFLPVLLFAAHPAHTEVVCSIKNRDEILGLIFSFLTLILALRIARKINAGLLLLLAFTFSLAMLNKATYFIFGHIAVLSLVLFTEVSLTSLLAIAAALALPGFFLLLLDRLQSKLLIASSIPIAALFLYYYHKYGHLERVRAVFVKFFKPGTEKTLSREPGKEHTEIEKGLTLSFYDRALPPASYFSFSFNSLLPVLLLITYFYFVFSGNLIPANAILSGIFLLTVFRRNSAGWWSANALYLAIGIFTSNRFDETPLDIVSLNVIILLLLISCIADLQKYFVASCLLLLTLILNFAVHISYHSPPLYGRFYQISNFSAFLLLYAAAYLFLNLRNKKVIYPLLALALINLLLVRGDRIIPTIFYVSSGMLIVWLVFEKLTNLTWRRYVWVVAAFTAIAFLFLRGPDTDMIFRSNIDFGSIAGKVDLKQINKQVSVIDIKQDRPIAFLEQPVRPSDPLNIRLGTAMVVILHYFQKTVVPFPMAFYYGYKCIEPTKMSDSKALLGLFVLLALILAAIYFFRFDKLICFGLSIYIISLVSYANFFIPIPGVVADRFLLVPTLGSSLIIIRLLYLIGPGKKAAKIEAFNQLPPLTKYGFAGLFLLYTVISFSRNFDWKDNLTLMKHDIAYVDNSAQAHNLLAINLMKKSYDLPDQMSKNDYYQQALHHFKKSLEIYPEFYNATYDLGRVFNIMGQPDSSIFYFRKAFEMDSTNPAPALFIGQMLTDEKRPEEAVPYLFYMIRHNVANDYQAYDKLSLAYFLLGKSDSSIIVNQLAISNLPPKPEPSINIARVYLSIHQADSARAYLQRALAIDPNNQNAKQLFLQMAK